MHDFARLKPTEHMLKWLAASPYDAILNEIEEILQQQVPGSQVRSLTVTSDPQWLTGARRQENSQQAILTRTGVSFEFDLTVEAPHSVEHRLHGVFSWAGVHLDEPEKAKMRVWFDLDATLETHGASGALQERIYFE